MSLFWSKREKKYFVINEKNGFLWQLDGKKGCNFLWLNGEKTIFGDQLEKKKKVSLTNEPIKGTFLSE